MKTTKHIHLYIIEPPALPPEREAHGRGELLAWLLEGAACVAMIVLCVGLGAQIMGL